MADRLLAPGTRGRERFGRAFLATLVVGWTGAAVAIGGTAWDARVDTEDALLAHFLGWFLVAYTIGAGAGLAFVRGSGIVRLYAKVVAWTLCGALIGGFLFVETAVADARSGLRGPWQLQLLSLLAVTLPWMLPLIAGGVAFRSALKMEAKTD